jgi:hypothetical protein
MSRYRVASLTVPQEVSWVTKVENWPMMLNDTLGDCVPAAMGHMVEQWSTYAGSPVIPTNAQVLSAYEAIGGYVPGDPSTDNGCDMLTALNYWRQTGIAGHKIFAFVQVNPLDADEIREAIYLFGNVFTGLALPISAQGEDAWTVPPGGKSSPNGSPGSWGGHCVPSVADSPQSRTVVTWGEVLKMSPNFFIDYVDELYAVLSLDWIESNGLSPSQFNLAQLQADLEIVTG